MGGQVGQAIGQLEGGGVAPQAEQADEAFARGPFMALGAGQALGSVGIEALFAGLLQLVEVAHLGHAAGQFGAGFGGLHDLVHVAGGFLGGQGFDIGLAGAVGELQHLLGGLRLGLGEAAVLQLLHGGHQQQAGEVDVHTALDFALVTRALLAEREAGVGQAAGLHHVGLGDAQFGQ